MVAWMIVMPCTLLKRPSVGRALPQPRLPPGPTVTRLGTHVVDVARMALGSIDVPGVLAAPRATCQTTPLLFASQDGEMGPA